MFDPTTGSTSYFSQEAGGPVSSQMLSQLQSGQAQADPANNRIVNVGQPGPYDGGGMGAAMPGRAPSGNAAGGQGQNSAALLGKIDDLWNRQAPTYEAPQQSEETGVNPADDAYFAASKTRIGNSLRGGMDLLNNQMSQRGISPDSRLAFHALGDLTRGALGEFADTERDLVFDRQSRNRDIRDRNVDRSTTALRDNQQAQQTATNRLSQLLSFYGMVY
jgi:hypothetical protein